MVTVRTSPAEVKRFATKTIHREQDALDEAIRQKEALENYREFMRRIRIAIQNMTNAMHEANSLIPANDKTITLKFAHQFSGPYNEAVEWLTTIRKKIDPKNHSRIRIERLITQIEMMNKHIEDTTKQKREDWTAYTTKRLRDEFGKISAEAISVGRALDLEMQEAEKMIGEKYLPAITQTIHDLNDAMLKEQDVAKDFPRLKVI